MSLPTMMNTSSRLSKRVFVDTSAFLALANTSDRYHAQAREQWRDLLLNQAILVTNNYVLVESMAIVQKRWGLDLSKKLQVELMSPMEIEWLDEARHNQAIHDLFTANRRRLSLVDCASFATMRRRGIHVAFTFDLHFGEQGFEVVPGG